MPVTLNNKEIKIIKEGLEKNVGFCISPSGEKILRRFNRALKPIKVSSAKAKGRELQKWVCQKIANLLKIEYNQQDDQCLIHSREMGQAGVDVVLRGEVRKRFPFSIECKNTEQLEFIKSIKQAQANTSQDEDWMVVHKRKALNSPVVILDWAAFEKLFSKREDLIELSGKCLSKAYDEGFDHWTEFSELEDFLRSMKGPYFEVWLMELY